MGYELAWEILHHKRSFLMRLSSKNYLYTLEEAVLSEWTKGLVYYWPERGQKKGKPPIRCRLIRIRASHKAKRDVWLLTDILDPAPDSRRLPSFIAGGSGTRAYFAPTNEPSTRLSSPAAPSGWLIVKQKCRCWHCRSC